MATKAIGVREVRFLASSPPDRLPVKFLRPRNERKRHFEEDDIKKATAAPVRAQSGVEARKIGSLLPNARNANKGSKRGQQMIEDSLRKFGAGRSILIENTLRSSPGIRAWRNAGAS